MMTMGIHSQVKLPVLVRVDNVEATFMSEHLSTNSESKHIDIRTDPVHFRYH